MLVACRMDEQTVWLPDPAEGFVMGQITDLADDGVAVQPLDRARPAVTVSYDRLYPAEPDPSKDVDDNCECLPLHL